MSDPYLYVYVDLHTWTDKAIKKAKPEGYAAAYRNLIRLRDKSYRYLSDCIAFHRRANGDTDYGRGVTRKSLEGELYDTVQRLRAEYAEFNDGDGKGMGLGLGLDVIWEPITRRDQLPAVNARKALAIEFTTLAFQVARGTIKEIRETLRSLRKPALSADERQCLKSFNTWLTQEVARAKKESVDIDRKLMLELLKEATPEDYRFAVVDAMAHLASTGEEGQACGMI